MKKLAIVLIMALLFCVFSAGCFTDNLSSLKQSFNEPQENLDEEAPTVVIEMPQTIVAQGEEKLLALYFSDESGKNLVLEERKVDKVTGIARAAMEELIKGPTQAQLKATLPVSTQLLDINIKPDGLAIVDFSGHLIKELPGTASAEKLAVYSIVNTLTQFPTVETVELRVDGKKVDTLLGYVKLNQALVRDTSLMK